MLFDAESIRRIEQFLESLAVSENGRDLQEAVDDFVRDVRKGGRAVPIAPDVVMGNKAIIRKPCWADYCTGCGADGGVCQSIGVLDFDGGGEG